MADDPTAVSVDSEQAESSSHGHRQLDDIWDHYKKRGVCHTGLQALWTCFPNLLACPCPQKLPISSSSAAASVIWSSAAAGSMIYIRHVDIMTRLDNYMKQANMVILCSCPAGIDR